MRVVLRSPLKRCAETVADTVNGGRLNLAEKGVAPAFQLARVEKHNRLGQQAGGQMHAWMPSIADTGIARP
jgi:hypothetical protein